MYILYYSPGTASMAVHQALLEIGAPHELRKVDFETQAQKSAEYLALNPNGMVPTLIVDGQPHYECAALLMLLAERHPEGRFQGRGATVNQCLAPRGASASCRYSFPATAIGRRVAGAVVC